MRRGTSLWTALCVVLVGACSAEDFIWTPKAEGNGAQDMNKDGGGCASQTDLGASAPACAAARGLLGDAIICEDFTNQQTALSVNALTDKGWEFFGSKPDCWRTSAGFLEISDFGGFAGECSFAPRTVDLNRPEFQKYQRITLSVIHRVDLSPAEHQARLFVKDTTSDTNQLYFSNNKLTALRQQMTFTLQRKDMANSGLNDVFKFIMRVNSSNQPSARKGWQFESIAVIGQQ